ncbi:unnamed protein product [Laminaria digitata]
MSREEFARSATLTERERRCVERGWTTRTEKVLGRFQHREYYLSHRCTELQERIAKTDARITRLSETMLQDVCMLLPPDDVADPDALPPDGTQPGDAVVNEAAPVSEKQRKRVTVQAFSTFLVLQQEVKRDRLQHRYVLEAKRLVERGTPKTAAAVKIADNKVFELLNDASIVRHANSLLKIATTVAEEAKLLHKPSTILGWVREFNRLGGFFSRDARGVHEREWILSEKDLKLQLLAWLKKQKRVTVQRVHKYVNEVLLAREGGLLKLGEYNLTLPISRSTIHSWMIKLGCTYERHTQSYYTDGHERPDVVESRKVYIRQKRVIALRQPVWVQIMRSALTPQELERLDDIKETGDEAFCAEVYGCEIDGKPCIELHVDFLKDDGCVEMFDTLREALGPEGGRYSVRSVEAAAKAYHIGQDESVYKAYAREGNEWVIQGVSGLRKKTEGPGEMVSAFQDVIRGFGLVLSEDELTLVNDYRRGLKREDLQETPGTRFLVVGKNKGGFWGFDEFELQTIDVMDVLEALEPNMQIVIEVDHSAGHAKGREDGLHVSNMNVKYRGKQRVLRESIMTEGCLGPGEAKMYLANGEWSTTPSEGATEFDVKPRMGEPHIMSFGEDAPPPFYDWGAPQKDQVVGTKRKRTSGTEDGVEEVEDRIKEGYAGKPKGQKQVSPTTKFLPQLYPRYHVMIQVAWERGWWVDGMSTGAKVGPEKNIATVLGKLPDFLNEKTALQHTVESRGHILLLSPKCHPEVAGVGIEYSWGMSQEQVPSRD